MAGDLEIKQFISGNCYSYIISSASKCIIIDPHSNLKDAYLNYIEKNKLQLCYVIDTHTHADHLSLAKELERYISVPILMHEKAISQVSTQRVKDGQEIALGNSSFKILYSPGHTDDMINIYFPGYIFTADTLLVGSIGRTDFQNGSPEDMFDSLQKIKKLPDNTKVFPGHDYKGNISSTIIQEKETNTFLKETNKDAFVANAKSKKLTKPFNMDNIIRINQTGQISLIENIKPKAAQDLVSGNSKIKFLDVRSKSEYSDKRIKDSINIPINELAAKIGDLIKDEQSYVVVCQSGNRATIAADMLLQAGMAGIKVLQGGLINWQKDGLPIIKETSVISLERQVRIIAGSLVLLGIALAHLINPAYIFISVFVGCGLIFAGITDNCLMGILLMKLPYNKKLYKVKASGGTCALS